MGLQELQEIVQGWRGARLSVVGDVMLDAYVEGSAGGLTQEGDLRAVKVKTSGWHVEPGGAARAALLAHAMGARVTLFGVVGDDWAAQQLRAALHADAPNLEQRLQCEADRPTTVKARLSTQLGCMARWDLERCGPLWQLTAERMAASLARSGADAVLLSDYGKGVFRGYGAMLAEAAQCAQGDLDSSILVLDPKDSLGFGLDRITAATPNRAEWVALGQWDTFAKLLGKDVVVAVTLGHQGAALHRPDMVPQKVRTVPQAKPETVVGAGDAFSAAFTLSLAACASPYSAALVACAAALSYVKGEEADLYEGTLAHLEQVLEAQP